MANPSGTRKGFLKRFRSLIEDMERCDDVDLQESLRLEDNKVRIPRPVLPVQLRLGEEAGYCLHMYPELTARRNGKMRPNGDYLIFDPDEYFAGISGFIRLSRGDSAHPGPRGPRAAAAPQLPQAGGWSPPEPQAFGQGAGPAQEIQRAGRLPGTPDHQGADRAAGPLAPAQAGADRGDPGRRHRCPIQGRCSGPDPARHRPHGQGALPHAGQARWTRGRPRLAGSAYTDLRRRPACPHRQSARDPDPERVPGGLGGRHRPVDLAGGRSSSGRARARRGNGFLHVDDGPGLPAKAALPGTGLLSAGQSRQLLGGDQQGGRPPRG